jgi:protein TonB
MHPLRRRGASLDGRRARLRSRSSPDRLDRLAIGTVSEPWPPPWLSAGQAHRGLSRASAWGALALSLALHVGGGLAFALGLALPPVPRLPDPIPVSLLTGEAEAAPASPAEHPVTAVPRPPPDPPRRAERPPRRPPAVRTVPGLFPIRAAPFGVADEASAPLARAEPADVPAPRIYGEHEVDRPAAPAGAIRPSYPGRERQLGREGLVVLRVTVGADGKVSAVDVAESGGPGFDAAAATAARVALFHPAERAGHAVASHVTLRVRFELD